MVEDEQGEKSQEEQTQSLKLEESCKSCDGQGGWPSEPGDCRYCNGSGMSPTPLGDKILQLVQHHVSALRKGRYE